MLSELSIDNFAIISHLLVCFGPGFTAVTGETGAGKSIIIDALQAALGARAPSDLVRTGATSASVEAVFDPAVLDNPSLVALLEEHGLDTDCLILRRDINVSGRGSARVNGRAVPVSVLAAFGNTLVDIHGQSDHLSILKRDRQLNILDRYGSLTARRDDVGRAVKEYGRLSQRLQELLSGRREAEQRLDLLRFQVQEIDAAQLQPAEEVALETERSLLTSAERRTDLSQTAYQRLHGDTGSALDALADAEGAVRDLAAIDPAIAAIHERVQSAVFELEDVAQELRQYRDSAEYDPQRLAAVEERLDLLLRLQRKYGPTLEDVITFGHTVRQSLDEVENLDDRIDELRREVGDAEAAAASEAEALSAERVRVAATLTAAMESALQGLGLKDTRFEASLSRVEDPAGLPCSDGRRYAFSTSGIDRIEFLVSFNPGETLRPLESVASGGETSRFLLALKSVLAGADDTPTLVFDEVDVGVGGRHGTVVGERMRALATGHQVLAITHLPQVAALADAHLTVVKAVEDGRATVAVRSLESAERVSELAEMMSGTGSESARQSARELLESARRR